MSLFQSAEQHIGKFIKRLNRGPRLVYVNKDTAVSTLPEDEKGVGSIILPTERDKKYDGEKVIGPALWDNFWEIIADTKYSDSEYGLKICKNKLGDERFIRFIRGQRRTIIPPNEDNYGDEYLTNIFFHTHPGATNGSRDYSFLPSGVDNGATMIYLNQGGMANVVNNEGITIMIHSGPLVGDQNHIDGSRFEAIWDNPLSARYENMEVIRKFVLENEDSQSKDAVFLFTVIDRVYKSRRIYLRVGRNRVENSGLSLDDLCFSDGLNSLIEKFHLNVPHEKNLSCALQELDKI